MDNKANQPANPYSLISTMFCSYFCCIDRIIIILTKSNFSRAQLVPVARSVTCFQSYMGRSRKFCQGPDVVFLFVCFFCLVINIFHRGPYRPPSRSNLTQGVQLLLEGDPYRNLSLLVIFQGGGGSGPPVPTLDLPMVLPGHRP